MLPSEYEVGDSVAVITQWHPQFGRKFQVTKAIGGTIDRDQVLWGGEPETDTFIVIMASHVRKT